MLAPWSEAQTVAVAPAACCWITLGKCRIAGMVINKEYRKTHVVAYAQYIT